MPGAEPGAEVVAQAVVLNKTRCLGGENRDKLSRRIVWSLVLIEFACCDAGCPCQGLRGPDVLNGPIATLPQAHAVSQGLTTGGVAAASVETHRIQAFKCAV